jgi:Phage tail tube protein, TTP
MSAFFPNGTIFAIATSYGSAITTTAVTNANPAVASATGHGIADGAIMQVTSGWGNLNGRAIRNNAVDANSFQFEGFDTSSTSVYPAGSGIGSVVVASTFVALNQITDSQTSGGEQQFAQWVYLEDGLQRQRPTFKNARSLQLTLDYDPSLAWHTALLNADQSLANGAGGAVVLRAALPGTLGTLYYNMYVGFDGEPTFNINQNQQVIATFSYVNPRSTRYS